MLKCWFFTHIIQFTFNSSSYLKFLHTFLTISELRHCETERVIPEQKKKKNRNKLFIADMKSLHLKTKLTAYRIKIDFIYQQIFSSPGISRRHKQSQCPYREAYYSKQTNESYRGRSEPVYSQPWLQSQLFWIEGTIPFVSSLSLSPPTSTEITDVSSRIRLLNESNWTSCRNKMSFCLMRLTSLECIGNRAPASMAHAESRDWLLCHDRASWAFTLLHSSSSRWWRDSESWNFCHDSSAIDCIFWSRKQKTE